MMARITPVSLHFSDVPTGWKKNLHNKDKQQLATGFACSSRTVSPDEHTGFACSSRTVSPDGRPLQRPQEMQQIRYLFVDPWHVTNMMPCLTNMQIRSQKQAHVTTHFLVEPNLRGGFQDFHQRVAQLMLQAAKRRPIVSPHQPQQPGLEADEPTFPTKHVLSHSLPCETTPRRSSSNLAADASSTCGIRHTATTKPPSSYNIAPCDKHSNSVTKTTHVTTHFLV